jgi:ATP-dependent Zn protease
MEDENKSGSNLLVVLNDPTPSEHSRVEKISQIYLEKQYVIVKDILNKNLNVLNAIAKQLKNKFVLSQEEIYQIYLNEKNSKITNIK